MSFENDIHVIICNNIIFANTTYPTRWDQEEKNRILWTRESTSFNNEGGDERKDARREKKRRLRSMWTKRIRPWIGVAMA